VREARAKAVVATGTASADVDYDHDTALRGCLDLEGATSVRLTG
jgi:hypothetical protein